jgi:hypothetical protein
LIPTQKIEILFTVPYLAPPPSEKSLSIKMTSMIRRSPRLHPDVTIDIKAEYSNIIIDFKQSFKSLESYSSVHRRAKKINDIVKKFLDQRDLMEKLAISLQQEQKFCRTTYSLEMFRVKQVKEYREEIAKGNIATSLSTQFDAIFKRLHTKNMKYFRNKIDAVSPIYLCDELIYAIYAYL